MGVPINAQENSDSKYVKALEEVTKIVAWKMRNPIIAVDFVFKLTPYKKIYEEALKVLHAQSREIIEIRRKVLKNDNITRFPENAEFDVRNKHAFLDQILLSEIDGEKIDDEGARQEVDTFMFAGHDTTAAAISFTLYCISEYDNIQEKILEEQKKIFDNDLNKKPTYRDLKQMKYLEMVIKESLRLFPPVPIIGRFITEDCDLGDIHVKKNTSVNINIFHMHRHPELHENPNKFCPERFDMSSAPSQNTFSSIPFSAGPRNCIGQKFAMMEIKITVAEIVKNFKLLPANIQPVLCADLVLKSDNGVHVHLTSRHC
ncbi:unnamed protein product [Leptosia nina]|uniref:Cytochrome P450 n=1 Tax=Leptosia nina TaxID=320188 RepID=A0AAV1JQC7_9NEOP